jgi:hypothetical protein
MSEKMYTRLLRLYPSRFRKQYEGEALQLIRDRLRNETGFFKRARLWWDMVADVFVGLPQTYRNSYAVSEAASLSPNTEGVPSFKVLEQEPLGHASILLGSTLSLAAMVAFGFLLSRSVAHLPVPDSHGRMSPIESVMERLNQPTVPGTPTGGAEEASGSSSVGTSERQPRPRPGPAAAASAAKSDAQALLVESGNGAGVQRQIVSGPTQSRNEHSPQLEEAPSPSANLPQDAKQRGLGIGGHVPANKVTVEVAGVSRDSKVAMEHDQNLTPRLQPRLENAFSAMIGLFDTHDIVMFGEVHDSEQEYEWLCKLVKTPGFSDRVDDIVVEFGNPLYQKTVDRYVGGEDVPFEEVQKAWRNVVGDVLPVSPEYGWLYKAVREANLEHRGKRGIRLVMGGPPADWTKIRNSADLAAYQDEREQWYARVVKTEVLAKHHHALLIMGAGHLLRGHQEALESALAAQQHREQADRISFRTGYVEREIRAAGAHPYLVVFGTNAVDNSGDVDRRFDSWLEPVLVPLSGNWVGALAAQPVISGGHAPAMAVTLADQADALLYVAPCSVLRTVYLSHAELDGTAYEREMIRRDMILLGHPVTFPYGALPECVQPQRASR